MGNDGNGHDSKILQAYAPEVCENFLGPLTGKVGEGYPTELGKRWIEKTYPCCQLRGKMCCVRF